MTLHVDHNRYPGVNAHLMGVLLQPAGGWESFHAEWIVQLRQTLDAHLPDNYYAMAEKSLQISAVDAERLQRTRPDVSVYQFSRTEHPLPTVPGTTPTAVIALRDVLDEMVDALTSVGIYQTVAGNVPGKLITRLEVISPGNKAPAAYAPQYSARRFETLNAGINLLEIDLIHTRRPLTARVPSYVDDQPGATPSVVLVSRPTPQLQDGQLLVYNVPLEQALPQVAVPLAPDESLVLDLQTAYNQTYAGTRIFPLLVDYDKDPLDLARYRADDRTWLVEFLAHVRSTTQRDQ